MINSDFNRSVITLALFASLTIASIAHAADSAAENDEDGQRHRISIGATWLTADVEFMANSQPLPEVSIKQEDIGLGDDYTSLLFDYRYQINNDWELFMAAFRFDVDGNHQITRDLNFDGVEYSAGATVSSDFQVDTYIVDLMYRVYESDRMALNLGLGLHSFNISTSLSGEWDVQERSREFANSSQSFLAPLPNLRLQALYELTPGLNAALALGWLSANYDDYEGDFRYAQARLHYALSDRFGVALGYQYTGVNVKENRAKGKLEFDFDLDGPLLELSYSF